MSGAGQTGRGRRRRIAAGRGAGMSVFTLYGLNEAGKAAHSEVLRAVERAALPALARERLCRWAAFLIW
jgi:hypothetical protein